MTASEDLGLENALALRGKAAVTAAPAPAPGPVFTSAFLYRHMASRAARLATARCAAFVASSVVL